MVVPQSNLLIAEIRPKPMWPGALSMNRGACVPLPLRAKFPDERFNPENLCGQKPEPDL
jgi:hypothetical protein